MCDDLICIRDFERKAAEKIPKNALAYFNSGATDQQTLEENCTAFKSWRFQPRVLRDVSNVDTRSSILGSEIPFPICVSPTAVNKMASAGGELDSAKAAASLKTGFTLSSWATTSIEEIEMKVPSVLRWFQIYVFTNRELTKSLVRRAEWNGFRALFLTVDSPRLGRRYQDARNKFSLPSNLTFKNFDCEKGYFEGAQAGLHSDRAGHVSSPTDASVTWKDVSWLKAQTNLPIVAKGILTAEMAKEAVNHGVDGIVVSNHGARQLDGVLPTINALPQVIKAVDGRCEVYLDGGVRNGGDVAKAVALGAKAVFIGRPMIWGMACDGERGARKVLEILRDEFELTMKLLGVRSIHELQSIPDVVIHQSKILAKL